MAGRTTTLDLPRGIPLVWDLLWDEHRWPELTDTIEAVDVLDPGDRHGNGRLRRIHQHRTFWDATIMMERTDRVAQQRSVEAVVHHHRADIHHVWRLELVPVDGNTTRATLEEQVEVAEARYPGETRLLTNRLLALRPNLLVGLA
jgi:hypothetical protein